MRPAIARRRAGWYRRCRPARPSVPLLAVRFEPGHHRPQLGADRLHQLLFGSPPVVVEGRPAGLVLQDPGPGEGPILDFGEDLPHLVANLRADHPRPAGIVTELGGVADAVA